MPFGAIAAGKNLAGGQIAEDAIGVYRGQRGGHIMGVFRQQVALQHQAVRVGLKCHGFLRVSIPQTQSPAFL